jgi:oxalate decarboxylase
VYEGGTVTNVRGAELVRLDGISFLPLYVDTGGVREPHWHPNAGELIYVVDGEAEVGLVGPDGLVEMFGIGPGDIAFFPTNWFHYVASVGDVPLDTIVYLSHAAPQRIDLSDAVGFFPLEVTATAVGLEPDALDALPQRTGIVVAAAPEGGR